MKEGNIATNSEKIAYYKERIEMNRRMSDKIILQWEIWESVYAYIEQSLWPTNWGYHKWLKKHPSGEYCYVGDNYVIGNSD